VKEYTYKHPEYAPKRELSPIVLFVYDRLSHTKKTIDALISNAEAKYSELYIFCDGPKSNASETQKQKIVDLRKYLHVLPWPGKLVIKENESNLGLKASILSGVTEIVNKYGKIIVLEDDIVVSPGFLSYMNRALDVYEQYEKVMHVGGFVPNTNYWVPLPETFFTTFMSCWGWATWKSRWDHLNLDVDDILNQIKSSKSSKKFNLEGALSHKDQLIANKNRDLNTWAIFWYATIFLKKGLCLYPKQSMVKNIGFDGSGVHCGDESNRYRVVLKAHTDVKFRKPIESKRGRAYLRQFYRYGTYKSTPKIYMETIMMFFRRVYLKLAITKSKILSKL